MFIALVLSLNVGHQELLNTEQASCMASAIYHEARDQPVQGQIAVAQVILNRAAKRKLTVCEVIMQRKQFSFTLIPYSTRLSEFKSTTGKDSKAKIVAVNIALQSMNNNFKGIVNGATHYYNPAKANPKWSKSFKNKLVIGDHKFVYN